MNLFISLLPIDVYLLIPPVTIEIISLCLANVIQTAFFHSIKMQRQVL